MENQVQTMSVNERAREAVTSAMATQDINSMDVAIEILKMLWEKQGRIHKFESVLLEMEEAIESDGSTNEQWLLQSIKNILHNDEVEKAEKNLCTCPDEEQASMYFLQNWCHVCEKHIS